MTYEEYIFSVNSLKKYDYEYWVLNAPTISDAMYDDLFIMVKHYEEWLNENHLNHQVLNDSPTQRISVSVNGNGRKTITRREELLSTEKVKTPEDVEKFFDKTTKKAVKVMAKDAEQYTIEWKYDGDSCQLIYQDGVLIEASYGKGLVVAECLEHIKLISTVPKRIKMKGRVEVRGEVVMPFTNLELTKYKNCRSAASGYLGAQQADSIVGKLMTFYPYYLYCEDVADKSHAYRMDLLRQWGFSKVVVKVITKAEFYDTMMMMKRTRKMIDFPVDGLVVKMVDTTKWYDMGATSHHPKYLAAWKFPPVYITSRLHHIELSVSDTGYETPVAVVEKTDLCGITVSTVNLHSKDSLLSRGLTMDSKDIDVILYLTNDVVPEIAHTAYDGWQKDYEDDTEQATTVCNEQGQTTQNEPSTVYIGNYENIRRMIDGDSVLLNRSIEYYLTDLCLPGLTYDVALKLSRRFGSLSELMKSDNRDLRWSGISNEVWLAFDKWLYEHDEYEFNKIYVELLMNEKYYESCDDVQ